MKEIIEKINCKYILPCGRCDRHGNVCDVFEYERFKEQKEQEELITLNDCCDHDWAAQGSDIYGTYYICNKCGSVKRERY